MESTVLIVTEDVNARIITETLLETHGFCVRSAADGAEACDLLCRRGTAVVVLDVADGNAGAGPMVDELKHGLDRLPVCARPRILALADADNPEGSHRALPRGADAVLHKPVSPGRLLTTVEHLMTEPRLTFAPGLHGLNGTSPPPPGRTRPSVEMDATPRGGGRAPTLPTDPRSRHAQGALVRWRGRLE